MVAYTIVMKWWWKKLLEEIKWELISFHPQTVYLDVILRSKATKNLIVSGSAEILRFAQNDMK